MAGPFDSYSVAAPPSAPRGGVFDDWQLAPPPAPAGPSLGRRLANAGVGFADAFTANYGDELAGRLQSLVYGRDPAAVTEQYRQRSRQAQQETPVGYAGGSIGGAVAQGLALPLSRPATALGALGQAARVGAATGAASASGASEGDLRERAGAAAQGGLVGAALGTGLEAVAQGVRAVGPSLLGRGPEARVEAKIGDILRKEGGDPAAAISRANAAGVSGMTVADVSEGARRVAAETADEGGPAQRALREFYGQRQTGQIVPGQGVQGGQAQQAIGVVRDLTGVGGRRAQATIDDIIAERAAQALPAQQRAYQLDPNGDPALVQTFQALMSTPAGKKAFGEVDEAYRNRLGGQPLPTDRVPSFEALDLMKRSLDDMVSGAFKPTADTVQRSVTGPALRALRDAFRERFRGASTDYAEYLDTFAGQTALKDAAGVGRDEFKKMTAEEVRGLLGNMTPGEQEAFRVGAAQSVQTGLERGPAKGAGSDPSAALRGTDNRNKLAALMPDPGRATLLDQALIGLQQQSETARRVAGQRRNDPTRHDLGDIVGLLGSNATSLAARAARLAAVTGERRDTRAMTAALRLTDGEARDLIERLSRVPTAYRLGGPAGAIGGLLGGDAANPGGLIPQAPAPDPREFMRSLF